MTPLASTIPASEKIGTLPWWDWLINLSPGRAFLVMLCISPTFMMFVLHPLVEGRMVRLKDSFQTFKMDIMFAPTLAIGLVLVGAMDNRVYAHDMIVPNVLTLAIWIVFGLFRGWQERHDYNWGQRLSPSALYHNIFLFGFTGYMLTMVGVMGLILAPWSFQYIVLRLLMLGCISVWALSWPLYDETHKEVEGGLTKYDYAHVDDGWPIFQHHWQYLPNDVRAYVSDLADVPARLRERLARVREALTT